MNNVNINGLSQQDLKQYLADKYPSKKADKVFSLAWDYGHASGNHEVMYYYMDLAELAQ